MGFSQYKVYKNDDKEFSKHLFKCGACGKSIVFDSKNRYYACLGKRKGSCSQGYIKEGLLEESFGLFVADLQRVVRKSQALKDLKAELRKAMSAFRTEWNRLDKQLAKEAKYILRVNEGEAQGLAFEVEGTKELDRERSQAQSHWETADELYTAIMQMEKSVSLYKEEPLYIKWYLQAVVVMNEAVDEVEFSPGVDYIIKLATTENALKGDATLRASRNQVDELALIDLLDHLRSLENSIRIWHRTSLKTRKRHSSDSDDQTWGQRLFQRIFMFAIKYQPFKSVWDRMENPTDTEKSIDYALSLDNAPYLYEGGSPTNIQPKSAIKVLEHHIKELEWLVKHQPTHGELYYEWGDQTRHLIGKIFGFESELYRGFLRTPGLTSACGGQRFREIGNENRTYLGKLISRLEANENGQA